MRLARLLPTRHWWMALMASADVLNADGCSACDKKITPPPASVSFGPLAEGQELTPADKCTNSLVFDAFDALCSLFPGVGCVDVTDTCQGYQRQIFTGTTVMAGPSASNQSNGKGGSGETLADAVICSLKELSPQLGGPLLSEVSLDVGLGTIRATEEVGFLNWQSDGANFHRGSSFNGYRKLRLDLPLLGRIDAITQDITIQKHGYGYFGNSPLAGDNVVTDKWGLDITTQRREQRMVLRPFGFDVATPVGPINVQPEFVYDSRTSVIQSPYDGNVTADVTDFLGVPDRDVRYTNIYGVEAGVKASTMPVNLSNLQHLGWTSAVALGNRDPSLGGSVWKPGTAPITRPDLDIKKARSAPEKVPSLLVSAAAQVKYPASPSELLPSWVFELPGLEAPELYVTVTPKLRAAISDQVNVAASEGTFFAQPGEFKVLPLRHSGAAIFGGVSLAAGFSIDTGFRLFIAFDPPIPFVDRITLVDLDLHFPIVFPELEKTSLSPAMFAATTASPPSDTLSSLQTFTGNYNSASAVQAFIDQCYAPSTAVPAEPAPTPNNTPGDPAKLFPEHLWPCNVCIFVPELKDNAGQTYFDQQQSTLFPSTNGASFECDDSFKNGCMDMCTWDQATNVFKRVVNAEQLSEYVTGTDKTMEGNISAVSVQQRFRRCGSTN